MDEFVVKMRPFDRERDEAFIYSSWRNQAFYSAVKTPRIPGEDFFRKQTGIIRKVLEGAHVMIACLENSPQVIAGYSVTTGNHLNWIYVKEDFRNAGIGKLLTPKHIETFTDQVTKIGKVIAQKKNLTLKGD